MTTAPLITAHEREALLKPLAAGAVPHLALRHIQVGRAEEIQALQQDVDRVAEGGATLRFIIGEHGAGKTFLLHLVRLMALERRCVTIHADLSPDRRLHAAGGQAQGLYAEAIRNMATRMRPEGGALASIVERFLNGCTEHALASGVPVERVIDERLAPLQQSSGDESFPAVLKAYWRGSVEGDGALRFAALRWLGGTYATRLQARQELGVGTLVDEAGVHETVKLLAAFVRLAGYRGLFVLLDEMVSLHRLHSAEARGGNFRQILHMFDDALLGRVEGLGLVFAGTPEFLLDTHRGLYSEPVLRSRLVERSLAADGQGDMSGPVLRLQGLTPDELLSLLSNIRGVFAHGVAARYLVPDLALEAFLEHCSQRIGGACFSTPRATVRAFVRWLAAIERNPGLRWQETLSQLSVIPDGDADAVPSDFEDIGVETEPPAVIPGSRTTSPAPASDAEPGADALATLACAAGDQPR